MANRANFGAILASANDTAVNPPELLEDVIGIWEANGSGTIAKTYRQVGLSRDIEWLIYGDDGYGGTVRINTPPPDYWLPLAFTL